MVKKMLPLVFLPLLLAGCATHFTNLTPQQQTRNGDNLYPVEVALASRQQTLRWDTIQPQVVVGSDSYPMRPTLLMTNRWEGVVPVARGKNAIQYHYQFEYNANGFGDAKPGTAVSPNYTLRIVDK